VSKNSLDTLIKEKNILLKRIEAIDIKLKTLNNTNQIILVDNKKRQFNKPKQKSDTIKTVQSPLNTSLSCRYPFKVYVYDINTNIIDTIKNNTYNYIEPGLNDLIDKYKSNLILSYDLNDIYKNCDIIFTFIQTPSLDNGLYNHEYINNFIEETLKFENKTNKIILINSTVIPEYCNTIKDKLKSNNFTLCYNPSFIAQGNIIDNIINPDIILIGIDDNDNLENSNKIINIYDKIIIFC
jgi:UDP-glucose 6-dehydrogenase